MPRLDPEAASFDHVRPKRYGGLHTLSNGLLKHRRCNEARGDAKATGFDLIWWQVVRLWLRERELI